MRAFIDSNLLIYLNVTSDPDTRISLEEFYVDLVRNHELYLDPLVLDELLWVSKKKYRIPHDITSEFIISVVDPFVEVLSLGREEILESITILKYGLPPSDALHLAAMKLNGIDTVVSEDEELDKVPWVRRIWLKR